MWKPAGSYSMTGVRCPGGRHWKNRNVTAGSRAGPLPTGMPNRISGKEVLEAIRIDAGQTRPPRSGVLKSRGCDAMTGAGGSLSGRSSESRERNGLGRSNPDRCTPLGKKSRNNEVAMIDGNGVAKVAQHATKSSSADLVVTRDFTEHTFTPRRAGFSS